MHIGSLIGTANCARMILHLAEHPGMNTFILSWNLCASLSAILCCRDSSSSAASLAAYRYVSCAELRSFPDMSWYHEGPPVTC